MKRILALIFCLILLLCGCQTDRVYVPTGDGLTWDEDYTGPVYTQPQEEMEQNLILTYYPERSMNPFTCTDFTNRALFSLLYQSLFIVDRNYTVEPLLCKSYSISEDAKTYTFYINTDATFANGAPLTATDVLASLQKARESDIYGGRFQHVVDITLGNGGISITLDTPYENLPLLLDIPILRADQVEEDFPLGTGPYVLEKTAMSHCLQRRTDWWCNPNMMITASSITLLEAKSATQIRDSFEFSNLSLVCADPGSDRYTDYRCDYELWDCENGIFLYLACSENSEVFSVPEIRSTLTYAIDREILVQDFYRGFARSATLPASPLSPYYSESLASRYAYAPLKFTQAVKEAQLTDYEVTLLVNSDDSLRARVAREIEKMLEDCGLEVTVSELSGSAYTNALYNWEFDLYLGQTMLSANMDLTAFFSGNGALRYGGVNDVAAYTLCQQALENHGNYYTLHQTVMDNGLLCPVLFRSYAVYAIRGLLTGLTPARDNVFYYSIGKTMDAALIRQ